MQIQKESKESLIEDEKIVTRRREESWDLPQVCKWAYKERNQLNRANSNSLIKNFHILYHHE